MFSSLGKIFTRESTSSNQKGVGGAGEDAAARFLRRRGYKIIACNWCNASGRRLGEIDLIARAKDGTIVFVESESAGCFKRTERHRAT